MPWELDYRLNLFCFPGPGRPYKPVDISIENITSSSVIIVWTVPSVAYTPESYRVYYESINDGDQFVSPREVGPTELDELLLVNDAEYEMTLYGLRPFTQYSYYITATNTEGTIRSIVANFTTNETGLYGRSCNMCQLIFDLVPNQVVQLNVTVFSSTEVTVEWKKPTFPNGIIVGYELNVTVLDQQEESHFLTVEEESESQSFALHLGVKFQCQFQLL